MNKKGQLSYEYIIVVSMILFLAIPFFFSFFRYLVGGFNNQMNADMVTRVAHATATLTNLGGVGSKFTVPVRVSKVAQNTLQSDILSIQTSTGQVFSAPATSLNIMIGDHSLVGDGFKSVPLLYTYLSTVVIGHEPQIVGMCPEDEDPYSKSCTPEISITPSDGFRILGANFNPNSEVILSRIQGASGGCQTMTPCNIDIDCNVGQTCENGICADQNPPSTATNAGLILDVSTVQTGSGDYAIAVANPGGEITECVDLTVDPTPPVCGDGTVDPGEECDPPKKNSSQCGGTECLSTCLCEVVD